MQRTYDELITHRIQQQRRQQVADPARRLPQIKPQRKGFNSVKKSKTTS